MPYTSHFLFMTKIIVDVADNPLIVIKLRMVFLLQILQTGYNAVGKTKSEKFVYGVTIEEMISNEVKPVIGQSINLMLHGRTIEPGTALNMNTQYCRKRLKTSATNYQLSPGFGQFSLKLNRQSISSHASMSSERYNAKT